MKSRLSGCLGYNMSNMSREECHTIPHAHTCLSTILASDESPNIQGCNILLCNIWCLDRCHMLYTTHNPYHQHCSVDPPLGVSRLVMVTPRDSENNDSWSLVDDDGDHSDDNMMMIVMTTTGIKMMMMMMMVMMMMMIMMMMMMVMMMTMTDGYPMYFS